MAIEAATLSSSADLPRRGAATFNPRHAEAFNWEIGSARAVSCRSDLLHYARGPLTRSDAGSPGEIARQRGLPPLREMTKARGLFKGGGAGTGLAALAYALEDAGFRHLMERDVGRLERDHGIKLDIGTNPYHRAIAQEYTENRGNSELGRLYRAPMSSEAALDIVRLRLTELAQQDGGVNTTATASADDKEPEAEAVTRPGPPLAAAPNRQTATEACEEDGNTIPPTEEDFRKLVAEHGRDRNSPPLTDAAARSIVALTQPAGTRAEVVGENVEGPDILYRNDCGTTIDTVQVKSVKGWNGFLRSVAGQLDKANLSASRILAVQMPAETDPSQWLARYWGIKRRDNPEGWHIAGSRHAAREILIVDGGGRVLLPRQPVFDQAKAN